MGDFEFPQFYHYPPSFTLQPVKETQERQRSLWRELVPRYCAHTKTYILSVDDADIPLFHNASIQRRLDRQAISLILGDLVTAGQARWLTPKKDRAVILWQSLAASADALHRWARSTGPEGGVVSFEELVQGSELRGSALEGAPREFLKMVVKVLEESGRARVFRGRDEDDVGIKFS